MTEAQVKAAYPSSTYTTGGVTYDVRMNYQKGRLWMVTLYPRDHYECGDNLKLSLDIRYGKGEITEGSGLTWKYTDSKRRNVIFFNTDASGGPDAFCTINYTPLDHTPEEEAEIAAETEASVSGL